MIDLESKSNLAEKAAENGNKTFTQNDVNAIVSKQILEERTKIETDYKKREEELAKREYVLNAKEVLNNYKISPQILDILNCSDIQTLEKYLKILDKCYKERYKLLNKESEYIPKAGNSNLMKDNNIRSAMNLKRWY